MKHSTTLSELGMGLDLHTAGTLTKEENPITDVGNGPTPANTNGAAHDGTTVPNDDRLDHFVEKDGLRFAGTHLIVDLWDAMRLDDLAHVEDTLKRATEVAGATLLNVDLHHFTPNGGVSGVAVLAESHISIHTWPECGYAAIDLFMCGAAEPHKAIAVFREAFGPARVNVGEHKRGIVE
ncbi:adenosylmethionine decarboxylase [Aquibaculum arenosum]|uniref:S-adenosylmethionine decarboxylase proenzyme n=1 Tax=Aquibaculum arenosum TaxID=3032591 RepID=A0ABT5YJC1_9PROT|nr:adenosylmethionine decarboxylase [Fodinicurvata sp. CAU 1616]MDF2095038.1 adenosylmethionine decarboxylase [Fodinicurvata sp. CAU 1616]